MPSPRFRHAVAAIFCAAVLSTPSGAPLTADPPERDDTVVPSDQRIAAYEQLLHATTSVGEDPSLATGRESFDVLHYVVVVIPDFTDGSLEGIANITFAAIEPGLQRIELDLYDNLTVTGVLDHADPVAFTHANDVLGISLATPLDPGETKTVTVNWNGAPTPTGPLGLAFDSTPAGNPTLATVSEPFYARSWWPCKDTVLDKATVDMYAVVPPGMFAASAGTLVSVQPSGGSAVYQWSTDYPMTTYNVSLAAADYTSWTESYVSPEGDTFPLEFHVFPEHESVARYEFERVDMMIDFFSGLYGPYPFAGEKYGMAEVVLAGAVEHQTMTSYGDFFLTGDRYYEGIVAHELSHHWWGNLLTLTDWDDLWLHEGLATFSDGLWREHIEGRDAYLSFLKQRSADCCGFAGPISPPSRLFNQTVYQKGAWMLHMLREWVGDQDFFAALQRLTADPSLRFGHFERADFIGAFEDQTGQDLGWFFDQWLAREGRPEIRVEWAKIKTGGGNKAVYLLVEQLQDEPEWRVPFRIRFRFEDGTDLDQDLLLEKRKTVLVVDTGAWPHLVDPDPDQQLLFFDAGAIEVEAPPDVDVGTQLLSNYPNPFNPRTALRFVLAEPGAIRLRVYDLRGRAVRTLDLGWLEPGPHQAIWDGTDQRGRSVASGNYLVRLEGVGRDLPARRVTLVR